MTTPPPRVPLAERYDRPPAGGSARLRWWLGRIEAGWRRNRRIGSMGYDDAAEWFGVYVREYVDVLGPRMMEIERHEREEGR
jgi:hypothetical protein